MGNIDDNYTFYLKIFFKNIEDSVFVKIRKKESERFERNIDLFNENKRRVIFFNCDTIDGKSIGVNLAHIQAVQILWEPSAYIEDLKHYGGPIKMLLKDRKEAIETDTSDPEELHDFYSDLEHGPEIVGSFSGFTDEDGERIVININELLYIEAPRTLMNEGWKIVKERDGIV
ncbi:hypothetical protein DESC_880143 [Desulfosarcina cetonica]|uniref:hypothetical protein n=1 Tax=Desulfosarcina cetonica TaxID=90730 RepID=UPI0006D1EBB2|nr:hypothetical protein [Desulfosarcina cetonica]VTR71117.1 hypothetical protein DESC_880143 [Desulfosarcina cetonica]